MRILLIMLLLTVIIVCCMLSYKIESFEINSVGSVVDEEVNPGDLDMYNCFDYIKKKKGWDPTNYKKGEKKVLATLRTGLNSTYQTKSLEPHFTDACILPKDHAFVYNFADTPGTIRIPGKIQEHVLNLDRNTKDSPEGYPISFFDEYKDESKFRDFLDGAYNVMNSKYITQIVSLCNQIYIDPGYSNIFRDYKDDIVPAASVALNKAVREYKPVCSSDMGEGKYFSTNCSTYELDDDNIWCCTSDNLISRLKKDIASLECQIAINDSNIATMSNAIAQADSQIDNKINQLRQFIQSVEQIDKQANNAPQKPPPPIQQQQQQNVSQGFSINNVRYHVTGPGQVALDLSGASPGAIEVTRYFVAGKKFNIIATESSIPNKPPNTSYNSTLLTSAGLTHLDNTFYWLNFSPAITLQEHQIASFVEQQSSIQTQAFEVLQGRGCINPATDLKYIGVQQLDAAADYCRNTSGCKGFMRGIGDDYWLLRDLVDTGPKPPEVKACYSLR